jgi:hypothetical protein
VAASHFVEVDDGIVVVRLDEIGKLVPDLSLVPFQHLIELANHTFPRLMPERRQLVKQCDHVRLTSPATPPLNDLTNV